MKLGRLVRRSVCLFWFAPLLILSTAVMAAELSGQFNPPPVGTVTQYNKFTSTIKDVNGLEITYAVGSYNNLKIYGWMIPDPRGDSKFDKTAIDKFWPLKVGKHFSVRATNQGGMWQFDYTVVRTEDVTVPAGKFEAFVLDRIERGIGHTYEKHSIQWYCPKLGIPIKGQSKVTKGSQYGRTSSYELVRVTYPGGRTVP